MLREKEIFYTWLVPEGVSFMFEGQRHRITLIMKAEEFIKRHKKRLKGKIKKGTKKDQEVRIKEDTGETTGSEKDTESGNQEDLGEEEEEEEAGGASELRYRNRN